MAAPVLQSHAADKPKRGASAKPGAEDERTPVLHPNPMAARARHALVLQALSLTPQGALQKRRRYPFGNRRSPRLGSWKYRAARESRPTARDSTAGPGARNLSGRFSAAKFRPFSWHNHMRDVLAFDVAPISRNSTDNDAHPAPQKGRQSVDPDRSVASW